MERAGNTRPDFGPVFEMGVGHVLCNHFGDFVSNLLPVCIRSTDAAETVEGLVVLLASKSRT